MGKQRSILRLAGGLALLAVALFLGATLDEAGRPVHAQEATRATDLCTLLSSPKTQALTWRNLDELLVDCGLKAPPLAAAGPVLPTEPGPARETQAAIGPNVSVNMPDPLLDAINHADGHGQLPETQSETTVAVFGSTVCSAWNDQHGPQGTGFGRSPAGGAPASWSDRGAVFNPVLPPGASKGDPVLAVNNTGLFYLVHMADTNANGAVDAIYVQVSTDDCQTFPNPGFVVAADPVNELLDKPWIAVDRTGGPFNGAVYVCWFDQATDLIRLAASPPGPVLGFGAPVIVAGPTAGGAAGFVQDCQVAVGPGGVVHVSWTDFIGGAAGLPAPNIHYRSGLPPVLGATPALGGMELVRAVAFRVGIPDPAGGGCPGRRVITSAVAGAKNIRNRESSTLAVNPMTGIPYVAWNENNAVGAAGDSDILFSQRVGGVWLLPVPVHPGAPAADQFMPNMTVSPSGVIKVQYYDRAGLPAGNIVLSDGRSVGGVVWANAVVSGVPFTLDRFVPLGNCYMGDYNGITADEFLFYHVWGDNREVQVAGPHGPPPGHLDPNVYFDKQNVENTGSLGGAYDLLVTVVPAEQIGEIAVPGIYFRCRGDIQKVGKDTLALRTYCYSDTIAVEVNPDAFPGITGDGFPGSPPPEPFGDVNVTHTELFVSLDSGIATILGCFEDLDGSDPLGHVYWELAIDAVTLQGSVDIWISQTQGDCVGATPDGPPAFDDAVVKLARLSGDKFNDSDGDGVPTWRELEDDSACGRRDPYNKNDYYDVSIPRDGVIDLPNDILGVILHFAPSGYPAGDENWDRPPAMTNNSGHWNRGAPDGVIDLPNDILGVILQFNPGGCPALF